MIRRARPEDHARITEIRNSVTENVLGAPSRVTVEQQYKWFERNPGIWVWEALVADAEALSARVLRLDGGASSLGYVLGSVLELPKSTLAAGALDVVKKACADPSLVPDETMQRLLGDSGYHALLGAVDRGAG